jgi:hypothetical protein
MKGEHMTAMRQNSPFAGVLTSHERWAIYDKFAPRRIGQQVTRDQLEHIIRASGTIADVADVIVIGSRRSSGNFRKLRRTC